MRASGITILGLAFVLRFAGLDFGLPMAEARPDELTIAFQAMKFGTGDLNPHSFNYPSLHKYVTFVLFGGYYAIGRLVGHFAGQEDFLREFFSGAVTFRLLMRAWSATLGTATVALLLPHSRPAAALLAVSFLPVRDSHFGVTDTQMVFLATASVLAARRGSLLVAAVLAGLATSTKYNAGLLAVPLALAARTPAAIARAGVVMVLAFLAGTPFAALDPRTFWHDFTFEATHLAEGQHVDVGTGWAQHLRTLWTSWGPAPLLFAVAGMARTRDPVLYSFPLLYFLVIGRGETAFFRYILPVFPFLCLAAATLVRDWRVGVGLAAPTLALSLHADRLFLAGDTRDAMGRWIEAHVPSGAVIVHAGTYTGAPMVQRTVVNQTREYQAKQGRADAAGFRKPDDPRWYDPFRPMYDMLFVEKPGIDFASVVPVSGVETDPPEWLLVEDYFLVHYSHVPPGIEAVAARYTLVHEEAAFVPPVVATFDQQDALYLPATGFAGFTRMGPTLRLYRR